MEHIPGNYEEIVKVYDDDTIKTELYIERKKLDGSFCLAELKIHILLKEQKRRENNDLFSEKLDKIKQLTLDSSKNAVELLTTNHTDKTLGQLIGVIDSHDDLSLLLIPKDIEKGVIIIMSSMMITSNSNLPRDGYYIPADILGGVDLTNAEWQISSMFKDTILAEGKVITFT